MRAIIISEDAVRVVDKVEGVGTTLRVEEPNALSEVARVCECLKVSL